MIIHIDAFTYEDDWDETILNLQDQIEEELEEMDSEDSEFVYEELLCDGENYDFVEYGPPRMPTFEEMINTLRTNPSTLFILWIEDEETRVRKYIMKDTYEHCLGFLEGVRYCGDQTGVYIAPLTDLTNIRIGLLAAKTCVEVNEFFDYIVFDK